MNTDTSCAFSNRDGIFQFQQIISIVKKFDLPFLKYINKSCYDRSQSLSSTDLRTWRLEIRKSNQSSLVLPNSTTMNAKKNDLSFRSSDLKLDFLLGHTPGNELAGEHQND